MNAARERRLLLAAIGYAGADRELQRARRWHRSGEMPDTDGSRRRAAAKERMKWKMRLLRAAGVFQRQKLLPLHKVIEPSGSAP